MKINYMSDLHLEFGPFDREMPSGDVLILGGDITLWKAFKPDLAKDDTYKVIRERTMDLVNETKKRFQKVVYLHGNHEPYGMDIDHAKVLAKQHLKGVSILDDRSILLGDVVLVGGTLWTDMNRNSAGAHTAVGNGMNDFRLVTIESDGVSRRFTTHDAYRRHQKTLQVIQKAARRHESKRVVVATHHAPDYQGTNPYHGGNLLDAGYASDLSGFIKANPNIAYWVHGHTHIQKIYGVEGCTVLANCRGYYGRESCAYSFKADTYFEV